MANITLSKYQVGLLRTALLPTDDESFEHVLNFIHVSTFETFCNSNTGLPIYERARHDGCALMSSFAILLACNVMVVMPI